MIFEDEYLQDERFFEFVSFGELWPNASLETVSKQPSSHGPYETNLIQTAELAWRTPFRELTCSQVSTLLEQKCGLQWLGRPALEFASRYPQAMIQYYPAEMVVHCLRAAAELRTVAPVELSEWLAGDFSWIDATFTWDANFHAEVKAALRTARATVNAR